MHEVTLFNRGMTFASLFSDLKCIVGNRKKLLMSKLALFERQL
jgi:hypothetical protein